MHRTHVPASRVVVGVAGVLVVMTMCTTCLVTSTLAQSPADVAQWLSTAQAALTARRRQALSDEWTFFTCVTEATRTAAERSLEDFRASVTQTAREASSKTAPQNDVNISTQLSLWKALSDDASSDASVYEQIISKKLQMLQLYSEALHRSRYVSDLPDRYEALVEAWTSFHDDVSQHGLQPAYEAYVSTMPSSAHQNSSELDEMTSQMMTLYRQLHAYVKKELKNSYGPHRMPVTGHIPAQFVDGPDGVSWHHLYDTVLPYKFAQHTAFSAQVSSVSHMLKMVDEYYQSLGYDPLPDGFWQKSKLTRPADNTTIQVCHPPRAWDFQDRQDYRLTSCLDVSHGGMRSAVELVGNVMAKRSQSVQPFILQQNSLSDPDYVSTAVSGALSLAFLSPQHLKQIGLLQSSSGSDPMKDEINFLVEGALDQLPPLAWYHVISKWQTTDFREPPGKRNMDWWKLRCTVEGVSSPVVRKETDFDPATSTDVLMNVPGSSLLQAAVAQFQILKALCHTAGHTGHLHACRLRGSAAVGDKIREVLSQGRRLSSSEKLQRLTGSSSVDVSAMQEYFQPLTAWLAERLKGTDLQWVAACPDPDTGIVTDAEAVEEFVGRYDREVREVREKVSTLDWNFQTNMTARNQRLLDSFTSDLREDFARKVAVFDIDHIGNNTQQRMLKKIGNIGTETLKKENKPLAHVLTTMAEKYRTGKVCFSQDECVALEPDLTRLMAESRNYTELEQAWKLWRDGTGREIKALYQDFVQLGNEGVRELGFSDMGEQWRDRYEDDNFQGELEALLQQLLPLYEQLHTYVRKRLKSKYGGENFPASGHIPAHILGTMWAEEWGNIYDLVAPYPGKDSLDVTDEMVRQRWTAEQMFHKADEFYKSLGLSAMPASFWKDSVLKAPTDGRKVDCHASAWNFYNGQNFRIKMCTHVTMEDLMTIHQKMGSLQYDIHYKDQPLLFQAGANPGFHEAIGETMALAVATPEHLQQIGLLSSVPQDREADLNFLLKMALEKIAFLPFGYLIDQWRWSVFSGDTTPSHYNDKWWQLRCRLQGVSPPVDRTSDDFDPGARFDVPDNTPSIRHFISSVLQFTIYQRLCEEANHQGPLHRCDFSQSQAAGTILQEMLQKGASEPWQDVLKAFNGHGSLDASAVLAYFQPLKEWLEEQNDGEIAGWSDHCPPGSTKKIRDESVARAWLHKYDEEAKQIFYEGAEIAWSYFTNLTDENQQKQVEADLLQAQWMQEKAAEVGRYDWNHFADQTVKRQFRFAADIGTAAMKNQTKLKELREVQSTIESIYGKAKVHDQKTGRTLAMEPGLTRLMATSRDYDELLRVWKGWRDVTGPLMKSGYEKFVALSNEALQSLGHSDTGEYWRGVYESDTLEADLEALLTQLSPLYSQLHAYVRRKLVEKYGASRFPYSGHIPAHLLGNMWAQSWGNLFDLLQPFPNKSAIDVTPELLRQGYTVEKIFRTADEFFTSMGLTPMPGPFWQRSMMERPDDGREVVCHASAWDFSNGKDFRIKMCTDITMDDLVTVHHEMGHIQYYLQYRYQPSLFRSGANPGFHEAIGDTLALSASTPKHLKTIQLLEKVEEDAEADLNFLMKMALEKIAFLPFGYLIDQWRWSVFSGDTTPSHYNDKWWQLRCKYQGISSPVPRNSTDFDAGAKYHVPANTPYIRYFIAHVLQFQFYKALCDAARHTGPLHTCDFYRSKEAGQRLSNMLQLGASVPWPDALEQITGSRRMDVGPLLEYFRPLIDWLEAQNAGQPVGWSEECPRDDLVQAARWLHDYDTRLEERLEESTLADWGYATNITDATSALSVKASVRLATFQKEEAQKAEELHWRNLSDVTIRRQFRLLTNIGPRAMRDPAKFEQMQTLQTKMEGIYGAGKVCLGKETECLPLEPDLEDIMAKERDYDRLLAVWTGWRNATGRRIKSMYQQFAALSNEGVREIGYADTGEFWRSFYESATFQEDVEALLTQLKPLYQQLHAYVRRKLIGVYGEKNFPETGHIPAHLLGNMWAQEWNNIYSLVQPYTNRTAIDVTSAMQRQNYTVQRMFRTAEAFFSSLGFEPLPQSFWDDSVIVKPPDRDIVCHGSAWDFYNAKDFRIKMCTSVNMEDLVTIHHEMGHIQYFMQYRHQPQMFRDGANPGFHEAVGDTIALSVATPAHLRKIHLLEEGEDNHLDEINFLLKMALDKIAFLPFGYLIDQWRWSVFSGDTTPSHYNDKWWQLRCLYQGISPPIARSADDFDPGAKYHIPGNTPYIRYFASFVLQFQFHQALCKAAGHTGPLHQCDIFHSEPAGRLLRSMLRKGSSQPWPDVLEEMTGVRKMDAGALMDYFSPLQQWLERHNAGERPGWTQTCPDGDQLRRTVTPSRPCPAQPSSGAPPGPLAVNMGFLLAGFVLCWVCWHRS